MALTTLDPDTALRQPAERPHRQVIHPFYRRGRGSTPRRAYEAGLSVTFAVEAMAGARPDAHGDSLRPLFPQPGKTGTRQEIIDHIAKRSI